MSKKSKQPSKSPEASAVKVQADIQPSPNTPPLSASGSIWEKLTNGWVPYVLISALGLLLYANTFKHEYALDDELVVCGNNYVLRGIDGLGDIMQNDIFDSYNKSINADANLAGGRFRPFSLATFAIEQEFIGTMPDGVQENSWDLNQNKIGDPNEDINKDGVYNEKDTKTKGMAFRHVNNVIIYIISVCLLYMFLARFFFKDKKILALLSALLFVAHPIHTEVVANVKSRDEILSLMFMILTMYQSFLYIEHKKMKHIWLALIFYFIALLSKEFGAALLVILPVSLYVYYKNFKLTDATMLLGGLVLTFVVYFMMRSSVVAGFGENARQDSELLNNPYMNATAVEALATKVYINLKYFMLMLLPLKLSSDYSYNTIPFRTFASPEVWLTIALFLGMGIGALYSLKQRNWLVIPILFIILPMLMINNFFFNVGATMGERLVYHSSLGVIVLLVYGAYLLFEKVIKVNPQLVTILMLPLLIFYSLKTFARNPAWKNNITLYSTDVKTYPESTMLNGNACIAYFDLSNLPANKSREKGLLDTATMYGNKALKLHPGYYYTHMNLGLVKAKQGNMDSATYHWLKARELSPYERKLPEFLDGAAAHFYNKGLEFLNAGNLDSALAKFNYAHTIKPNDHRPLYYLGLVYMQMKNPAKAKEMWAMGLKYAPGDQVLQKAYNSVAN
jgi:protein O-mannosyl-transferase